MKTYRIKDYKDAKAFFDNYMRNKKDYAIIHYACKGFYDDICENSPRIAAICILFPSSMQKHVFSLAALAELQDIDLRTADDKALDELEKIMLKSFYDFVKGLKKDIIWLHWNMKDQCYGFSALAQRYCKLNRKKTTPYVFADDKKRNIASLLQQRYGNNYVDRPHQQNIMQLNQIQPKNLMSGQEEAAAFERKEFLAIERSLQAKVTAIAEVLDRTGNNELKTKSRLLRDIYGISLSGIVTYVKENIILSLLFSIIGGILGNIISTVITNMFSK